MSLPACRWSFLAGPWPIFSIGSWSSSSTDGGTLPGPVGRGYDGFEFVHHRMVPGEHHMGQKFGFECCNTGCRRCEFGVGRQGEGVPEPPGIEFEHFCANLLAGDVGHSTRNSRASLGLRQREDNPKLPSAGSERDGVEVPPLAEENIGCPEVKKRAFNVFPRSSNTEGITARVKTPGIVGCHTPTMPRPAPFRSQGPRPVRKWLDPGPVWVAGVPWV